MEKRKRLQEERRRDQARGLAAEKRQNEAIAKWKAQEAEKAAEKRSQELAALQIFLNEVEAQNGKAIEEGRAKDEAVLVSAIAGEKTTKVVEMEQLPEGKSDKAELDMKVDKAAEAKHLPDGKSEKIELDVNKKLEDVELSEDEADWDKMEDEEWEVVEKEG